MSKELARQDISFKTECDRFNYRLGALLLQEGKILFPVGRGEIGMNVLYRLERDEWKKQQRTP